MQTISLEKPAEYGSMLNGAQLVLIAGGEFRADDLTLLELPRERYRYLAIDRGLEHCLGVDIVPDVILGDLDSVGPEYLNDARVAGIAREVYPARKDASDLEMALHWLLRYQPAEVTLMGISGGRTDHMLFNWMLSVQQRWPFSINLIDTSVRAYVVTPDRALDIRVSTGQLFSVLPLIPCAGVSVLGAEYPLTDATLDIGSTLGLSNLTNREQLNIAIESGQALVMLVRSDSGFT